MTASHHLAGNCDGFVIWRHNRIVTLTDTHGRECKAKRFDSDDAARDAVWRWRDWLYTKYDGCPLCGGDCAAANPPVMSCPIEEPDK